MSATQNADYTGRPSAKPVVQSIMFTYETIKNDPFFEKMLNGKISDSMKFVISPIAMNSKNTTIELLDFYVLEQRENFDGVNNKPMATFVKISFASIIVNEQVMDVKYWKVTDPNIKKVATTVITVSEPKIARINWLDDQGESIEETAYGKQVSLVAEIDNHEGGSVTITIEKEDGTEFENGQKQLTFEEAVDDEGKIELTTLEIKEQWEEFKKVDVDKLIAKVEHNGSSKKSGALKIVPPPKVLVNFRTGNGYKGDYGFDWLRMEDTGKKGDVFYKDIIGSYATGSFVQSDAEYVKLGKKFEMPQHPIKTNDKYVVSVLALLPNKKAMLTLKVEIEDTDAKKIEYKYDKTYFKLNKTEISHKTIGKKELADDLTIECIKEFGTDQFIEVEADGKFAGKLKVIANDKAHRYKANVVFVEVKVNIGNGVTTGSSTGEKAFLEKYLNQGLIKPNIITKTLNLTANTVLNSTYKLTIGSTVFKINDISGIHAHLTAEFDMVHSGYNNYFKVFFFNEAGGEILSTGYQGYNGAAESINSKAVVLYNTHNTSTTTHETLHAMGLYHSFDDSGKFTFEKNKTDNIMDYSHQVSIDRVSTWLWQWNTIWANPNVIKE